MAGKTGPSRRTARGRMAELVETIGPPISSVPWSPDFVAQTLEVLPVGVRDGALFWMKPMHADSLRVGLPASAKPAEAGLGLGEPAVRASFARQLAHRRPRRPLQFRADVA